MMMIHTHIEKQIRIKNFDDRTSNFYFARLSFQCMVPVPILLWFIYVKRYLVQKFKEDEGQDGDEVHFLHYLTIRTVLPILY